jgi:predicted CXXCH cytochrome family protein
VTREATELATRLRLTVRPVSRRARGIVAGLAATVVVAGSLTYAIAAMSFKPPTWVAGAVPAAVDLRAVTFTGSTSAYAVGTSGAILRTTDRGATWSALASETTCTLNAVDFTSSGPGWAVGGNGVIRASTDGTSWRAQSSGVTSELFGVCFTDPTHGWAVGRGGTVIATADGGAVWTTLAAGVPHTATLRGVAFADKEAGWAWGDGGIVARTTDGGSSWATGTAAPEGVTLYAGAFLDERVGWVAGSGGVIRKTTDGGTSWTAQTVETTVSIFGITFIDADRGFLVGGESASMPGVIAGTVDGGATWTMQDPGACGVYRAVQFADADHGLTVGDGGTALRTVPDRESTTGSAPSVNAPAGTYARAMQSGEVLLGWTESVNAAKPVTYRVWRSVGGGDYTSLAIVPATDGTRFTDTSAPARQTVGYKVSTLDPTGESTASSPATVWTGVPQAPLKEPPATMSCASCHRVHQAKIYEVYPDAYGLCFGCHPAIGERLSGDDASTRHDLLRADQSAHGSRIGCANCHNPHILSKATPIVDPDNPSPRGGMPRVTDEFCLTCHDESLPTPEGTKAPRGVGGQTVAGDIAATWGRDVHGGGRSTTDPHLRPEMGYAKGDALSCVTCHDPHGSTNRWTLLESVPSKEGTRHANALLVRPVLASGADLRLFCSGCHVLASHPTVTQHGADLTLWPVDCTPCHFHGAGPAHYHAPPGEACQLRYIAGSGGTIRGTASQTVSYGGGGSAVIAVPNAGYRFVDWSDGVKTASRTDSGVTGDVIVTAVFAIDTCQLRYTAGSGGTISGSTSQTVSYGGGGSTVRAVPNAGYRFVDWSDDVKTASRTDSGVTTNITVTAVFTRNLIATKVAITSNRTTVTHKHPVIFRGTISSSQPKNTHVVVYARKPGSRTWVKLSTRHTTSTHRWSYTYSPPKKGTWYFRARFAGTTRYAACTSSSRRIAVK